MKLFPANWAEFQHYKDRRPVWIKLHRTLLDNFEWFCLPVASRALAPCIWLLASEYQDGIIDATEQELAFRLRCSEKELIDALKPLVDKGFIVDASNSLAGCYQDAILETETEKRREEKNIVRPVGRSASLAEFNSFWEVYPKKSGKGAAEKAWGKALKMADGSTIIGAVRNYKFSEDAQFVPLPATWLNQRRWEDEQPAEAPKPVRKERDLRNVPDALLSNDDYWKKRTQLREWK